MALVGVTTASILMEALVVLRGFSLFDEATSTSLAAAYKWQVDLNASSNFYVIALIASVIAFLAWLSRAVDNVPTLGGGKPIRSPRGAIGWWFVPLANFFVPYQIVGDLRRRMAISPSERGGQLVLVWWALWIGGLIALRILEYAADSVTTIPEFRGLMTWMTAALLGQIIAGGLLIRIIWQIEEQARSRASMLPSGNASVEGQPAGSTASEAPTVINPSGPARSVAFCPRCGAARITGTRFCAACGTDLEAIAPQA